jgi:hypothetical protein
MRHKHYDMIIAWADGAEIQRLVSGAWFDCDVNPNWDVSGEYRIKPKMVKVGRHEWPEPLKELTHNRTVWTFSFEYAGVVELFTDRVARQAVLEGVAHSTREAAEQHRAALRCINRGDIN